MELHISLIGRMDLSGEIYRQLRGAFATVDCVAASTPQLFLHRR
jgi:hypothetical protein